MQGNRRHMYNPLPSGLPLGESTTLEGEWHVPKGISKMWGVLELSPDTHARLALQGKSGTIRPPGDSSAGLRAVYGTVASPNGWPVVVRVDRAVPTGGEMRGPWSRETYVSGLVVVGSVVPDDEEMLCHSLRIHITGLRDILGWRPLSSTEQFLEHQELNASYKPPAGLSAHVPALHLDIHVEASAAIDADGDSASLSWEPVVVLEPEEAIPFRWLWMRAVELVWLATLLHGATCSVTRIEAKWPDEVCTWSQVWLYDPIASGRPTDHRFRTACQLSPDEAEFEAWVQEWFRLCSEFEQPIVLLSAHWYTEEQYAESTLLQLTAGLEGYHTARYGGSYIDEANYSKVVEALNRALDQLPPLPNNLRQALQSRLKHGNDYSLRRRLNELCRRFPPAVTQSMFPNGLQSFVDAVVDGRNVFSHGKGQDTSSKPVSEVIHLTSELGIVARLMLLMELGLDPEQLHRAAQAYIMRYGTYDLDWL